jgi:VCBS repeat-containing protein
MRKRDAETTESSGKARFNYTVADVNGVTGTATVAILIHGINDPPIAVPDVPTPSLPSLYVRANTTTQIDPATLLANDIHPDINDSLSLSSVSATSTQGAAVTIINGKIVFDPRGVSALNALVAGKRVTDQFIYTIIDTHGLTASTTVGVVVQSPLDLPPTAGSSTFTIGADGSHAGQSVLANASKVDALPGDPPLQAVVATVTSALGARVTIVADGTFTYDASNAPAVLALPAGQTGADSFPYKVADAFGGVGTGTINLIVQGRTQAPVARDDTYTGVSAGRVLVISAAAGVLVNDYAPNTGDHIVVNPAASDSTSAGGATVSLSPDGSFTYDPTTALAWILPGQTYTDTFSYTIVEDHGLTATATVHLVVTGVDHTPSAPNYDISSGLWTVPGQVLNVPASQGLLSQATSPNQGVTAQLKPAGPSNGLSTYGAKVTVNPDGSYVYDPTSSPTLQNLLTTGQDVVDTFKYSIIDPYGGVLDPTVSIVVKGTFGGYKFDLVAGSQNGFTHLGTGPSINNLGHVGFQGSPGNVDSIYVWSKDTGYKSLISPGMLNGVLPPNTPGGVPSARFAPQVQLNDNDTLLAERQMGVQTAIGILPLGIPELVFAPALLTYAEAWDGTSALAGKYTLPQQVAVGDMGISAAGITWGNPLFLDMYLAAVSALLPGLLGFAATAPFTLVPRAWILNPTWASVFFSPVDPVWAAVAAPLRNDPGAFLKEVASIGFFSFKNDFTAILPAVSLNNKGGYAFAGWGSSLHDGAQYLVTARSARSP